MPRKRYLYRTPLGSFASSAQAAAAHHCDKGTIMTRCERDPDNYQKVEVPLVREMPQVPQVRRTAWPLSWNNYRGLDYDTREQIYLAWCHTHQQDPDSESAANAFFDEMDQFEEHNVAEPEADLDEA